MVRTSLRRRDCGRVATSTCHWHRYFLSIYNNDVSTNVSRNGNKVAGDSCLSPLGRRLHSVSKTFRRTNCPLRPRYSVRNQSYNNTKPKLVMTKLSNEKVTEEKQSCEFQAKKVHSVGATFSPKRKLL